MRLIAKKESFSAAQTEKIGFQLACLLGPGEIVALYGPVGAGKTCFVRGLAEGLGSEVPPKSPSFSLINEYPGKIPLIHFDFYRLVKVPEIEDLGWTDYLDSDAVIVIEWADRLKNSLPERTIDIYFKILDANTRELEIFAGNDFGDRQLG